MTGWREGWVRTFAAHAQRLVIAAIVLAFAVLPTAGPFLHQDGPGGSYHSIICPETRQCAQPHLPERAQHRHPPQLAVQRSDNVRRHGAAAQPMAVAAPAQPSWAVPARWRHATGDHAPAQRAPTLTRSSRGPPTT